MACVLLIVSGCTQSPAGVGGDGCAAVFDTALREIDFETMDKETLVSWVQAHYELLQIEEKDYVTSKYDIDYEISYQEGVWWTTSSKQYYADFTDGELKRIMVMWRQDIGTKGKDIIRCLGEPSHYSAIYRFNGSTSPLSLNLYYQQQAIYVWMPDFAMTEQPPRIDENNRITRFAYTFGSTPREILANGDALVSPNGQEVLLSATKPWQGWDAIEVTSLPFP